MIFCISAFFGKLVMHSIGFPIKKKTHINRRTNKNKTIIKIYIRIVKKNRRELIETFKIYDN